MLVNNLFENVRSGPDERIEELVRRGDVRIERIISNGQRSPDGVWFDQKQDEWVIVLRGAARLRFEDDSVVEMREGSFLHIPAHQKHRVDWTDPDQPTIWLAVHFS